LKKGTLYILSVNKPFLFCAELAIGKIAD